jgi:hypothetical protein
MTIMQTIDLERNSVPAHLLGGYKGKRIRVSVTERVTIPMDAGLWSGGTRRVFHAVRLADGKQLPMVNHDAAPWGTGRTDQAYQIERGIAVLETGSFCGKDSGLHFHVHPLDAAPMLPAPAPELTDAQYDVLHQAQSLKAFARARGPRVDAIKAELLALGLMDKRGAITVKGSNVVRAKRGW